jgi:Mrp family chromosome partitioning ATPase
VLVMDAAHHNPTQHKYHNLCCDRDWHDIAKNGGMLKDACYRTVNPNLFVSPLARLTPSTPYFVDIQASVTFLDEVKKRFDLILIDSAPAAVAPDSIAMSRYADGVILVIEAERTRWTAAEHLRDRILKNGGNILGVVFNKRRYHIPDRLYRWLYC